MTGRKVWVVYREVGSYPNFKKLELVKSDLDAPETYEDGSLYLGNADHAKLAAHGERVVEFIQDQLDFCCTPECGEPQPCFQCGKARALLREREELENG